MSLRDAAQQALEALKIAQDDCIHGEMAEPSPIFEKAITALRAALAEPKSDTSSDYERGFIDGMQKQMQSSVDKAVNRMAALSEPQPEPVAWALRLGITQRVMVDFTENSLQADNWRDKQCDVIPLYTHPPQRQPLTDEQIVGIYETPKLAGTEFANGTEKAIAIFRAAERAHGIGGDK